MVEEFKKKMRTLNKIFSLEQQNVYVKLMKWKVFHSCFENRKYFDLRGSTSYILKNENHLN